MERRIKVRGWGGCFATPPPPLSVRPAHPSLVMGPDAVKAAH